MPNTHDCPGKCGRQIRHNLLACPTDWWRLPQPLRDAVNAAWAARKRNPADTSAAIAHRHAVAEALTWYRNNPQGATHA